MQVYTVRGAANWINLSTPLGLLVAKIGRATITRGPRDLHLAHGYHINFPRAGAFTVGSVILTSGPAARLTGDVLDHEEKHSTQWAACGGLPFLPLYVLAAAWSHVRSGNPATANWFERRAGLAAGGYPLTTARLSARATRRTVA
jgi:hypothetical protein